MGHHGPGSCVLLTASCPRVLLQRFVGLPRVHRPDGLGHLQLLLAAGDRDHLGTVGWDGEAVPPIDDFEAPMLDLVLELSVATGLVNRL